MTKQEIYDAFCALYAAGNDAPDRILSVRPVFLAHPDRSLLRDRWEDCSQNIEAMNFVACYIGRRALERELFPDGVFADGHLFLCVNNEDFVQKYLINLAALLTHRRLAHDYDY